MKLSAQSLRQMKGRTPIAMLTAYTTPVARSLETAGIPIILVGDTLGMVEMGFDSTRHTTLDHMCYHVGAVRRGAPQTHLIGDLPTTPTTIRNRHCAAHAPCSTRARTASSSKAHTWTSSRTWLRTASTSSAIPA